jgi:hypothetical protein
VRPKSGQADDDLVATARTWRRAYSEEHFDYIQTFGHYDGTTWTPIMITGGEPARDVVVVGPREAFGLWDHRLYRFYVPD